jgi:hypothetical protein
VICPHCGVLIEEPKDIQIPDQMKNDNWAMYALAKGSNNPEVMIPYTHKLVGNLMASVKIARNTEYDELLTWCWGAANVSVQILSDIMKQDHPDKDWGRATIKCEFILSQLQIMIYDPKKRWAITQSGAFRYPGTTAPAAAKMEVK